MTTPWSVPRDWVGETVAVLASGPSMSAAVAETVRGRCRVIAVGNQGIDTTIDGVFRPALAPWADMLYAADYKWWVEYGLEACKFEGLKVTARRLLKQSDVHSLEVSEKRVPFDDRPTHVVSGANGGYQAVHIAVQRGASRILLCGFDMRTVNDKKHWFGDHPRKLNTKQNYRGWIVNFELLAPELKKRGVEVINCTPKSALHMFARGKLEEVLSGT
jgi:hypothetical protein